MQTPIWRARGGGKEGKESKKDEQELISFVHRRSVENGERDTRRGVRVTMSPESKEKVADLICLARCSLLLNTILQSPKPVH